MNTIRPIALKGTVFIIMLAASLFLFWGTAFAVCNVNTFYFFGFPITYKTGDCSGGGATAAASPTASLTATPGVVSSGGSASLSWSSTNTTSCTGRNFSTGNRKSGSATVKPIKTTTYVVSCSGGRKSATASKTVTVTAPTPSASGGGTTGLAGWGQVLFGQSFAIAPVCTPRFSVDTKRIFKGERVVLSWNSGFILGSISSGPSMFISWQSGTVPPTTIGHSSPYFDDLFIPPPTSNQVSPASSGATSVAPTETTTYIATCTVTGGIAGSFTNVRNSAPVTITVLPPVSGSCSGSPSSVLVGGSSTWTANPSGGDGKYSYSWSGSDGLSGSGKSATNKYTTVGDKTASVQITSAGSSKTINCSNAVAVSHPPVGASCSASPTSLTTGGSSTWTASPSGGNGTYTYSWSGTDSLSGTTKSVAKTYTSIGTKTASVTVTSAGSSNTTQCTNVVTVSEPLPSASLSLTSAVLSPFDMTATLSWSVTGVKTNSCTLTGTNGDSWNLTGANGTQVASGLVEEVTYTLACKDLNGDPVSTATIVGIIFPDLEEM